MSPVRRRFMSALLLVTLGSIHVEAAELHVHRYADHAHGDHQHGVAAHRHAQRPQTATTLPRLVACEPGDHAELLAVSLVVPPHLRQSVDAAVTFSVGRDTASSVVTPQILDTRVHGPPQWADSSLRAPPPPILPD